MAGLIRIEVGEEAGEAGSVGFGLDPDFQGSGDAAEALREVVRLGFEEFDLRRMRATADIRNERSWNVLERAGVRRTERTSGHKSIRGSLADSYLYVIDKDESW